MYHETVSLSAAFLAGLISFFTPCVLPLIPAYFTFITGFSLDELTRQHDSAIRKKVFISTLFYVSGFSLVFILLGASATYLGGLISGHTDTIKIVGGIIVLILGIHLSGLLRIRLLDHDKRLHVRKKPLHLMGIFIIGMAFGAGWSPCIGPLLGTILIVAGSKETISEGILLLSLYSAGMALPFLILSCFIQFLLNFIRKASKSIYYINKFAGVLLILIGLYLIGSTLFSPAF